ncbi:hypothetical protein FQR65_LT08519 [Abscondita terminalis]|nr:hypothetical protein FQR65_LT08519 [Abscondita terminalis]
MYLMSGHDLTVASVLAALEVFKPHVPKYNAAVLIELHQEHSTEQYLIKMYYVKGVDLSLEQLYIKGCPYMCTLEDFIEAVKSNLVDDYEVECEQPRYD